MSFANLIEQRRTIYALGNTLPVSESDIEQIVAHAVKHTPSAFNSQSARVVVLFGDAHAKLWNITMENLRQIVPAENFEPTEGRINGFAGGAGTVLFFEDQSVVEYLMENFALYAKNFPVWSEQSSGMLQYVVWTSLAEVNVGASLQHYNEVIADDVEAAFEIPSSWKLIAQMPFGNIVAAAGEKDFQPLDNRFKVIR